MNQLGEKIYNVTTYGVTFAGIAVNFESMKSVILFTGAIVLLALQIKLHWIKIQKERKNKE